MAASKPRISVDSLQEHIQMCENHDLPVDLVCEDYDEFICSTCAKTDHYDHNWVTQGVAASQRRKGLLEFLRNITQEQLPDVDKKIAIKKAENEITCESQRKILKKHFDEIIAKLTDITERKDDALKSNLCRKNEQLTLEKSRKDKIKNQIIKIVKYMEENNRTMSDKNLVENHRDLKHLLGDLNIDIRNSDFSQRYEEKVINDDRLESLFGDCFDLDNISASEIYSFHYVACSLGTLVYVKALNENECYVYGLNSVNVDLLNKQGEKKQTFNIGLEVTDMCVTNNGMYFTTNGNLFIHRLLPSGSISTFWRADSVIGLQPLGISTSVDSGFIVSLVDCKTDNFVLDADSRRLVKHLTLTGDVIHEYEYQEDGQTRLFTLPEGLCQNNNSDICVINMTSSTAGEVLIISVCGNLQYVYRGQNLRKNFYPTDLLCDSAYPQFLYSDATLSFLWYGNNLKWFDIIHTDELMPTMANAQQVKLLPCMEQHSNI
ncbi:uncharacterized protein LOC134279633 [Saccostrea cucullata]|uniref:uncharacterized protein LOC134279633 n=1 Tax=Saccostrea cuccullata TaxID=36930 RepID=UPI002ED50CF5